MYRSLLLAGGLMNSVPRPLLSTLLLLCATTSIGCDDHPSSVENQDVPFYYYFDQRIYLEADANELVMGTTEDDSLAVASTLETGGLSVKAVRSLRRIGSVHHWSVVLEQPTNTSRLAVDLWKWADIVFAAPLYRTIEHGTEIRLVNRIALEVVEGTSPTDIEALASKFGLTTLKIGTGVNLGEYLFAYPASANVTALELAAEIHRHEIVEWSSVDMIAAVTLGGP